MNYATEYATMSAIIIRRVAGIVVLVTVLAGCGGGFSSDSRNADELGDAIFGPALDTAQSY